MANAAILRFSPMASRIGIPTIAPVAEFMLRFNPAFECYLISLEKLTFFIIFSSCNMLLQAAWEGRRRYYNFFWMWPGFSEMELIRITYRLESS